MANILIIDDEEYIRDILSVRVRRLNHSPFSAATIRQGRKLIRETVFDLIFLDVNLPDGSGLDLLQSIKQETNSPEVVIITAVGSHEGAEIAIKNGAWDYLNKPLKKEDINLRIERALEFRKMKNHRRQPVVLETGKIIGKSKAIKKCLRKVAQCAASHSNVLLHGETGTGKEVFANAIHSNCRLSAGNFIVVDCAAMTESLAESVLFGHVKGAFTGADKASDGLVLKADKGTLFLDEIGELPLSLQSTFLRVLQEKRIRPVGSHMEKPSDFRLISATNRDLDQMVEKGTFRRDLLHRIRTIDIELPPLKARKPDIRELASFFISDICQKQNLKEKVLLPETLDLLESYDWPGNVRELIHTIEQSIVNEPDSPLLYPYSLPDHIRLNFVKKGLPDLEKTEAEPRKDSLEAILLSGIDKGNPPNLKDIRNQFFDKIEKIYLKAVLAENNWDVEKTAGILGVGKNRVYVLTRKYNLKQ
ncbi:sigma-54-dependent transcriptional regulator [Desulfospira joergensenii]|uniref:sigma-54-dependent transcriptional regulator n=1 Tax=Desulfospira joergensenii TaxID=53329 RepID=UPI0003B59125|nr:sigma-54 dependent transcriptional regulator [Desulfospira joergensenii]